MKYGIREICDVVLRAKSRMKVGDKIFYKDEPVIYFDSLKTSSLEGAATTVYAQGGRGNSRLVAWEGERTVTFTMEDALISTVGLAILTGANVISATAAAPVIVHTFENVAADKEGKFKLSATASSKAPIYAMLLDDEGNVISEPYLCKVGTDNVLTEADKSTDGTTAYSATLPNTGVMVVDYYVEKTSKATQIEITPDKFGGNFYLEASTLFRDTNGVDMPAEFIIPNCKVQSNFTFTMASSGDPSTFTFTMDAFPDYTRFDKTKKVLSVIQIVEEESASEYIRVATDANPSTPDKYPTDDKIEVEDED